MAEVWNVRRVRAEEIMPGDHLVPVGAEGVAAGPQVWEVRRTFGTMVSVTTVNGGRALLNSWDYVLVCDCDEIDGTTVYNTWEGE